MHEQEADACALDRSQLAGKLMAERAVLDGLAKHCKRQAAKGVSPQTQLLVVRFAGAVSGAGLMQTMTHHRAAAGWTLQNIMRRAACA